MSEIRNTSLPLSYKDRIDYILMACLYCWNLWLSKIEYYDNQNYVSGFAQKMVGMSCWGFEIFPVTVVFSVISTFIGWHTVFEWKSGIGAAVIFLMALSTVFIGGFKFTGGVFDSHHNLAYFRQFKKQDDEWLKKWEIYTILLFAGSLALIAMSLGFACLCIWIDREFGLHPSK